MSTLTFYVPTPKNGQTHSNNSLAVADELFECVWPFCGFDAESVKPHKNTGFNLYISGIMYNCFISPGEDVLHSWKCDLQNTVLKILRFSGGL